eukprot:TRINITY_DN7267_c0_g1_i1.p1 TRINITY_DN7267_c0_g1~~TRINITY_DN7267_c0_g1_i1.p1  ORF type:complete len:425 (-),score=104.65 TRINITY_DN7267_c0_g1_i1:71-1345(-)
MGNLQPTQQSDNVWHNNAPVSQRVHNVVAEDPLALSDFQAGCLTGVWDEVLQATPIKLDLCSQALRSLPFPGITLSVLVELNISDNLGVVLPEGIWTSLPKLRRFVAEASDLSALPAGMGALTDLEDLALTGNKLACIPNDLGQCPGLGKIDLSHNPQLLALPASLEFNFPESVNLAGNITQEWPSQEWCTSRAAMMEHLALRRRTAAVAMALRAECVPVDIRCQLSEAMLWHSREVLDLPQVSTVEAYAWIHPRLCALYAHVCGEEPSLTPAARDQAIEQGRQCLQAHIEETTKAGVAHLMSFSLQKQEEPGARELLEAAGGALSQDQAEKFRETTKKDRSMDALLALGQESVQEQEFTLACWRDLATELWDMPIPKSAHEFTSKLSKLTQSLALRYGLPAQELAALVMAAEQRERARFRAAR